MDWFGGWDFGWCGVCVLVDILEFVLYWCFVFILYGGLGGYCYIVGGGCVYCFWFDVGKLGKLGVCWGMVVLLMVMVVGYVLVYDSIFVDYGLFLGLLVDVDLRYLDKGVICVF